MTIDYRRLARAFGGNGGQPRPRNSTTGAAQPEASEARTSPAALPGDDVAPSPSRVRIVTESTPAPAPVVVSAVDALLAALDAAGSDMERGYLLESTSVTVREELAGMLAYRAMTATPPSVALDALMAGLDSAVDDAQRAALLSTASRDLRTQLADKLWWRRVSADDAQQRYLDMCR
jgi:hypothetical protein